MLPRHEAMSVQMAAPDLRCPVVSLHERSVVWRGGSSKFKFELQLANGHWIITHRAHSPCAHDEEYAARGDWHSAALDGFAGFLSENCFVGHRSLPRIALPVHAQRVAATTANPDGGRAEIQSTARIIHRLSSRRPYGASHCYCLAFRLIVSAAISTGSASISTSFAAFWYSRSSKPRFGPRGTKCCSNTFRSFVGIRRGQKV